MVLIALDHGSILLNMVKQIGIQKNDAAWHSYLDVMQTTVNNREMDLEKKSPQELHDCGSLVV
jgi:hypothetical protein